MKILLAIIALGLLTSCQTQYSNYQDVLSNERGNYKYFAMVEPESQLDQNIGAYGGSQISQSDANKRALNICNTGYTDCVLTYEGSNRVYKGEYVAKSKAKQNEIPKVELASMIDKAKDTCKNLGFKDGSEKFSDCSLKLYSQSVELAAEQNKTVVMQPQSSGSNTMTIYDPVRDSNALIRQGQRMMSGACTLGIDC
tara:strand:- start:104 stop:694 length:591 start_codon:yes stop_codon:yes gene_type:complete